MSSYKTLFLIKATHIYQNVAMNDMSIVSYIVSLPQPIDQWMNGHMSQQIQSLNYISGLTGSYLDL